MSIANLYRDRVSQWTQLMAAIGEALNATGQGHLAEALLNWATLHQRIPSLKLEKILEQGEHRQLGPFILERGPVPGQDPEKWQGFTLTIGVSLGLNADEQPPFPNGEPFSFERLECQDGVVNMLLAQLAEVGLAETVDATVKAENRRTGNETRIILPGVM